MENGLSKNDSKMLYGIAIIMMIYHHCFISPTKLGGDFIWLFPGETVRKLEN